MLNYTFHFDFTFFLFQVDAQPSVIACEQELTVPGHSSLAFSDPELQVVMRMKILKLTMPMLMVLILLLMMLPLVLRRAEVQMLILFFL